MQRDVMIMAKFADGFEELITVPRVQILEDGRPSMGKLFLYHEFLDAVGWHETHSVNTPSEIYSKIVDALREKA